VLSTRGRPFSTLRARLLHSASTACQRAAAGYQQQNNRAKYQADTWRLRARRHCERVDDQRIGRAIRSVRRRRQLRQSDLARLSGVSQSTVSRIERGHLGSISTNALRAVGSAIDVRLELVARWRAADLDRLLNSAHSGLHESVARSFRARPNWLVRPEISFSIYGERGVVDLVAWHPDRRALCIIELKTSIVDVNELIGVVDRKRRLGPRIVANLGWAPATVSVWVIVGDGRTNRRRIQAHQAVLRAAFPSDGRAMPGWLSVPDRPIAALSTWPVTQAGTGRRGRRAISAAQAGFGSLVERGRDSSRVKQRVGPSLVVRG